MNRHNDLTAELPIHLPLITGNLYCGENGDVRTITSASVTMSSDGGTERTVVLQQHDDQWWATGDNDNFPSRGDARGSAAGECAVRRCP